MDVLNHNFIRLGLTRAIALQTASRFPKETRRRFAAPKSYGLTPNRIASLLDNKILLD